MMDGHAVSSSDADTAPRTLLQTATATTTAAVPSLKPLHHPPLTVSVPSPTVAPATTTTTPTSQINEEEEDAVYVAYPRPPTILHDMHALPLMPSTVGRHNGFLRTYKVIIVGEAGVGKSNLMHRYCYNKYDPLLPSTLGAEFCSREVDIPSGPVGATEAVVLQLWDTAGQERNTGVISNAFYRNAVGAIVVYDVSKRESLLNVPRWVARVRDLARDDCVCVVVGAKADLLHAAQVARNEGGVAAGTVTPSAGLDRDALQQEADRISHALGMRNFLTSAITGDGVLEAFTHLVLAVDAVQAAPPEAHAALQEHYSGHRDGAWRRCESQMWTAASTVPASPVGILGSREAARGSFAHGGGDALSASSYSSNAASGFAYTGGAATAACGVVGGPMMASANASSVSPHTSPSVSGHLSPGSGSVNNFHGSPPRLSDTSPPRPAKKTLDLRGFGSSEQYSAGSGPSADHEAGSMYAC